MMEQDERLRRLYLTRMLGSRATPQSRLGTMGLYIPAGPSTTIASRPPVAQEAWGKPTSEVSSRPVGTPGPGETSSIPSQVPPGIGEEAWRTPTGNIIPESTIQSAMPSEPVSTLRGDALTKAPASPPTTAASIGSPTAPGQTPLTQMARRASPYQPTSQVGIGENAYRPISQPISQPSTQARTSFHVNRLPAFRSTGGFFDLIRGILSNIFGREK
jgi:hypothetical protein